MRLDGVKEATVSYENSNVVILMKEGKTLTEEQLKKAFEGSKFSVTSFKKAEK